MVYTYNGILFTLKKEWNSETSYNMDEPWKHLLSEISQTQRDPYWMILWFHEVSRIETESRIVVTREYEERTAGIYYLMGAEFTFEKMKFWKWMVVMVVQHYEWIQCHWLVYFEKWVQWLSCMLGIFYHKNLC